MADYRKPGDVESFQASVDSAKEWLTQKEAVLRIYQSDLREANVDLNSAEAAFNAALNDPTKTLDEVQALSKEVTKLQMEIQKLEEVQIPTAQDKVANAQYSVQKSEEALQESIAYRAANPDESTADGETKTNVENAAATPTDTSQADTTRRVTSVEISNGQTTRYYSDGSSETDTADGQTLFDDGSGVTVVKADPGEDPTNGNAGQKDYSGNNGDVPYDQGEFAGLDKAIADQKAMDEANQADMFYNGNTVTTDSNAGGGARQTGLPNPSASPAPAKAEWKEAKDLRAILRVPPSYLTSFTDAAKVLKDFGGIIFPYTPQISFDHSASYTSTNPLHSNYTQFSYKNSSVGQINVTAKFTVQNENDGIILLGVIHLLRALTRMKFGPDKDAGAPPPVCRFQAYGDFMLQNVPVTVATFRHELPDGVDYIAVGRTNKTFGPNLVPIISTITLSLNPTYSRSEMMAAGVDGWLKGSQRAKGYL